MKVKEKLSVLHTNIAPDSGKRLQRKWLGEDIGQLIMCINELKHNVFLLHMISYEVMYNLNVLCPRMLNRILCEVDGACIVTPDRYMIIPQSIIQ